MAKNEYIKILEDSLEKKIDLLKQLQVLNEEQRQILEDYDTKPDELDENMEKKSAIVDRLNDMDEGFQSIFDKVKDDLNNNKTMYADSIKHMQEMIKEITDRSSNLQATEMQNKELARNRFSFVKKQIKETRKSNKVVASYYKSMMTGTGYDSSQFWDKKK